jgi:hypothetical protein
MSDFMSVFRAEQGFRVCKYTTLVHIRLVAAFRLAQVWPVLFSDLPVSVELPI